MGKFHYKCRKLVEIKLNQARYVYFKKIKPYQGKIIVYGGLDREYNCHPLDIFLACFFTQSRSIFQYILKEIKERVSQNREVSLQRRYDTYIQEKPILKMFRDLRNSEIHVASGGHSVTISLTSKLTISKNDTERNTENKPKKIDESNITYEMTKMFFPDSEFYERVKQENKNDIIDAIESGSPLYEKIEFEGEKDLFTLCEMYLTEIGKFFDYCIAEKIIS
jgi:hypothetical protein